MRSRLLLVAGLMAVLACRPTPPPPCAADSLTVVVDSLRLALVTADTALSQQRVRARFAQLSALRYARIVARNPSQSVFLNGWMARAFEGMLPEPPR